MKLRRLLAAALIIKLNLPETSLCPCVWPHNNEAWPQGAACHTQTQPGSPGRTSAKPSPLQWHQLLAICSWGEKKTTRDVVCNRRVQSRFVRITQHNSKSPPNSCEFMILSVSNFIICPVINVHRLFIHRNSHFSGSVHISL